MNKTLLVGAGLGLVAAVVFASATTGPFFVRFLLMFLTPLPIALAGLGWGWRSAVAAGVAGSAVVLLFASPVVAAAFALTQAVPMAVLTYLALLSRPFSESGLATETDGAGVEWELDLHQLGPAQQHTPRVAGRDGPPGPRARRGRKPIAHWMASPSGPNTW